MATQLTKEAFVAWFSAAVGVQVSNSDRDVSKGASPSSSRSFAEAAAGLNQSKDDVAVKPKSYADAMSSQPIDWSAMADLKLPYHKLQWKMVKLSFFSLKLFVPQIFGMIA